ncbi:hypothetical protein J5X84_43870 [Streptosporangiaceae bacterium NEAU-GS5]|nr:hypothetical protein [Streptosporangiaceae bacterium NEAU-GS5]
MYATRSYEGYLIASMNRLKDITIMDPGGAFVYIEAKGHAADVPVFVAESLNIAAVALKPQRHHCRALNRDGVLFSAYQCVGLNRSYVPEAI